MRKKGKIAAFVAAAAVVVGAATPATAAAAATGRDGGSPPTSTAGLNSTTRPWWSMVIQQSSADSKIADFARLQGDSSRMPDTTLWPRVNTALLLLVLVGGEGAVKLPVRRSVWRNREDTDA